MGLLAGAGVVAFIALILNIIGKYSQHQADNFEEKKHIGKAEIVGYDQSSGNPTASYSLMVKIPELSDGKLYSCEPAMTNLTEFPKGKTIDVLYAPVKIMGVDTVEVHLISEPPVRKSKLGQKVKKLAKILMVTSLILAGIGVISLIL